MSEYHRVEATLNEDGLWLGEGWRPKVTGRFTWESVRLDPCDLKSLLE